MDFFLQRMDNATLLNICGAILAACFIYELRFIVYQLCLSPLSAVPGPKLAAITSLYAFYHDVLRGGQYVWVIQEMHERYGPIVRIRPDTVHINDPSFIDQVFGTTGSKRDKSQLHCNAFTTPGAFIGTKKHDLHRARRAPMNPFFSKQSIRRLEPIEQECLRKVLARMEEQKEAKKPLNAMALFAAMTSDIITEYSFGESWGSLDAEDLNGPLFKFMHDGANIWHISSYLPSVANLLRRGLPDVLAKWMMPEMEMLIIFFERIKQHVVDIKSGKSKDASTSIIQSVLDSTLPESEKSTSRLFDEAQILIGAGTDTTATALSNLTYYFLSQPDALAKLKKELAMAIPDENTMPSCAQVDNLPYLNASIKEVLRLHPPGCMRQERIAQDQDLIFSNSATGQKYPIPRGTSMAMSAPLLGNNTGFFPSPREFRPERFLENPLLDKYTISWARGSRICLGQNLALSEICLTMASIFRKFDAYDGTGKQKVPTLELFETSMDDVNMVADFALPHMKKGSQGVRLLVR